VSRPIQLLSVLLFAATVAVVPGAVFELRDQLLPRDPEVEVPLDVLVPIDEGLAAIEEAHKRPKGQQVAYLGDSLVVGYPPRRTVPERLQQSLDAKTGEGLFEVHTLASPGMGPFDFYFIADRVATAGPDLVILPINLTSFSKPWRNTFARPQLAALLPAHRVPQALLLPFDWIGLTADRLFTYFAIGQLGGLDAWHELSREQALTGNRRKSLAQVVGKRWGDNADTRFALGALRYFQRLWNIEGTQRFTSEGIAQRYGPTLRGLSTDDPTLRVLEATIRIFRRYDVDVLVYVNPTNVEHMKLVGALDEAGLEHSIDSIREVSIRAGARFVDLHALLKDDGFRDAAGHFNVKEDGPDGPAIVAGTLAPVVYQEALKRSRLH
jgi:hypothetical protein